MAKRLDISDEERAQISREIDHFFMFTEDVLADPTILEHMPDASCIEPIPIEEREPGRHYDIETPRTVATVTAPTPERSSPTSAARRR